MPKRIENIVIVGGGSAGWMSAATLINFFPDTNISVIESPNIGTVGVGESTLGGIRHWMHYLGIKEDDFMKHTNASYKMSIKFTDFYNKDAGSFHYPFGEPVLNGAGEGLNEWLGKKSVYPETPVEDYCNTFFSAMPLINNNKYNPNLNGELENFRSDIHVAYHFDAALFGAWLRDHYSVPKGVNHIVDEVTQIKTSELGIESLTLNSGTVINADLFVDCTGFKSMLLAGALNEPFISYADMLPNNRAWAVQLPYVNKEKELEPYTNCTAIGHGWAWNIPLWSRLGTGYVYSDNYIDPEDAKEEYKQYLMSNKMTIPRSREEVDLLEFKDIKMRIGIHERTWVKNVVAIGLSAGFIEPLESNGLFSVHEFLMKLVSCLDRGYVTQWDRDTYNTAVLDLFNNLSEFVALHYALSVRDDTNYWQAISNKTFSPDMVKQVPTVRSGFADLVNKRMFRHEHNAYSGIHCIAAGMNYFVFDRVSKLHTELTYRVSLVDHVNEFVARRSTMQEGWQNIADNSPTLYQYLLDNIHHE